MSPLARFHALSREDATEALLGCCHSRKWAARLEALRPFPDRPALFAAAEREWQALGEADWLEAFRAHPKIGELGSLAERYSVTRGVSQAEQKGVEGAPAETIQELARLNEAYEKKFGFLFIVCATGKSAAEMLALLAERIGNSRETELRNCALEQGKITRLRMEKIA